MNSPKTFATAVFLCLGLAAAHLGWAPLPNLASFAELGWGFHQVSSSAQTQAKDRARIVLSQQLSRMDGDHLKGVLVEVRYGPGEASSPHTHSCAVIADVAEGAIRTQVQGEPEMIYQSGQSFYEPPNGVHLVSANASSTEPAKLIAYLVCDRDAPLSLDVPDTTHAKGEQK